MVVVRPRPVPRADNAGVEEKIFINREGLDLPTVEIAANGLKAGLNVMGDTSCDASPTSSF